MNGKRRTAIRQCLIDGFHGIATTIVDVGRSRLDAAINIPSSEKASATTRLVEGGSEDLANSALI
jgi:hypothetical protein